MQPPLPEGGIHLRSDPRYRTDTFRILPRALGRRGVKGYGPGILLDAGYEDAGRCRFFRIPPERRAGIRARVYAQARAHGSRARELGVFRIQLPDAHIPSRKADGGSQSEDDLPLLSQDDRRLRGDGGSGLDDLDLRRLDGVRFLREKNSSAGPVYLRVRHVIYYSYENFEDRGGGVSPQPDKEKNTGGKEARIAPLPPE